MVQIKLHISSRKWTGICDRTTKKNHVHKNRKQGFLHTNLPISVRVIFLYEKHNGSIVTTIVSDADYLTTTKHDGKPQKIHHHTHSIQSTTMVHICLCNAAQKQARKTPTTETQLYTVTSLLAFCKQSGHNVTK